MADRADERFSKLSERHRECLRLVYQHKKSAEISSILGISARYVDNLLIEAKNIIGVSSRADAAVQLAAHEGGVESIHPVQNPSSHPTARPLLLPVPTSKVPSNTLTVKQVLAWIWVIAIATPIGMTTTAMAVLALMLVFGMKPS